MFRVEVLFGSMFIPSNLALDHTRRLKLLLSAPTRVLNDSLLIDHYAGWKSDFASGNESFAFMREKLRRHKHSLEVKKQLYSEAVSSEDAVLWDFDEESILFNVSPDNVQN